MDIGNSPNRHFSMDYQSGAMSFEIFSNGKKLICNCGYYQNKNVKLKQLSKTTATHSTLIIDNSSSCKFKKIDRKNFILDNDLKILKKRLYLKRIIGKYKLLIMDTKINIILFMKEKFSFMSIKTNLLE